MVTLVGYDNYSGSGSLFGPSGTPTTTIIAPPDDRYLPGYTIVDVDGSTRTVGPRLIDLNVPFSLYGLPIPISWGVRVLRGNTIWAQPLTEVKNTVKTGGKGGGPSTNESTYSYFATFAVAFGTAGYRNAILSRKMMRVWGDGTLIYDRRAGSQGDQTQIVSFKGFEWYPYTGTNDRPASPIIESYEGVGNVPAFRDLMVLVVDQLPVEQFGNRFPAVTVEFGDVTSLAYDLVSGPATAGFDGEMPNGGMLVDWLRSVAYFPWSQGASPPSIGTFDLKTGVLLNIVPANPLPDPAFYEGFQATTESYTYIPWLNKIIAVSNALEASQGVIVIDPNSGWGEAQFGDPTSAASLDDPLTLNQVSMMCPIKVYTLTGVSTFIIVGHVGSAFSVLGFSNISGSIGKTEGVDIDYEIIQLFPGEIGYGYSVCYALTATRIIRIVVHSNGSVGTDQDFHIETGGLTHGTMWYYGVDDSYIISYTNNDLKKFDRATGSLLWIKDHTIPADDLTSTPNNKSNIWLSDLSNGYLGWASGIEVYEVNIATGDFTIFTTGGSVSLFSGGIFDSKSRSVVSTHTASDRMQRVYYDKILDSRMNLSDFILGTAVEAGLLVTDLDIDAAVDDLIDGAVITAVTTFRTIMDSTAAIYRLDVIESDGKIKVRRKAESFSAWEFAIPESDLVLPGNGSPEDPTFTLRRERDVIMPQRASIRFIDKSLDYQYSIATASRSEVIITNQSAQTLTIQTPIIMLASEAKLAAHRMLWTVWASKVGYSFILPPKYFDLEPADVGTVTAGGITYTIKAVNVTFNADFSIAVEATGWNTDSPLTIEAFGGTPYIQTIPGTPYSQIFPLDIPLLLGSDDLSYTGSSFPMYYYVAPLTTGSWRGGFGYMSRDGINFDRLLDNAADGFVGVTSTALPDVANRFKPDEVNTLEVYAVAGDSSLLATITDAELLAGGNAAVLGKPGRWEVIQFRDVTPGTNPNQFTLSYLHRGMRGTDLMCNTHIRGDQFLLLDSEWMLNTALLVTDVSTLIHWKGVGYGMSIDQEPVTKVETVAGYGALPWPVGNLRAERETVSIGDITIKWNRRSRTYGELEDLTDFVPITDYEENDYRVTVYRNAWTETPISAPIAHADGEDVAVVVDVTGVEEYTITAADLNTYLVNRYDDEAAGFTDSYQWEEMVHLGLAYSVGLRYIYVKVQQKTNLAIGTGYGPGAMFRVEVRDVW